MKQFLLFLSLPILMFCSCTKDPKGIVNMRDLSNYIIADSLHIRQGMLFRAAHLADATDDEIQYLATLPTTKIIDFRLEDEKRDRADRVVHGAEYINIPIDASGNVMAQATDEEKKKFGGNKRFDLRKIIVMIAFNDKAKKVAREMYHNLFFNSDCQAQYAHFFRELIATDIGAILYHCTQGKEKVMVLLIGEKEYKYQLTESAQKALNKTYELYILMSDLQGAQKLINTNGAIIERWKQKNH